MIGAVDPPNHAGGPCPSDGCEPRGSFEEKLERWATSSGTPLEAAYAERSTRATLADEVSGGHPLATKERPLRLRHSAGVV